MDAQLKKGILEICILQLLKDEDLYGYPIMQEMKRHFPDVNDSTFYAILRRMNQEGLTRDYTGKEANGPPRKYYHLTAAGKTRLEQGISEWRRICNTMEHMGISVKGEKS